jgi:type I restriction-modification system DNA methylase subunit
MISNADTRNWFTVESGRFVEESFTVPPSAHSAADLKPLLEECGYTGTRLKEGYAFDSMTVPLVGFATKPWDFDSACIAVMVGNGDSEKTAHSCRGMGAPIVWVQHNGTVDWWMQHAAQPELFESTPVQEFGALVKRHKHKLDPVSVYRGKTIARVDKSRYIDFVDMGLLPLLREEAGKKLHDLVEEMTRAMLMGLGGGEPSKEKLRKVFTAVFRLLGGKILKDKGVHGFKGLDLTKPVDVLSAVEKHYGAGQAAISITDEWKTALTSAASSFSNAGNFGVVSPETLAYVYEHTLVTKALRKKLGIHATPPWLVDYMVWQLYDWIREIPENDRHVFEPAYGHAPFLLSAMRLLRLEMQDRDEDEVHNYLKSHIHGVEIDDFAREIARLSLTLADIPNPNGWDLHDGDMYASDVLMREAAECRILLSNPPYEAFGDQAKRLYARNGQPVTANTKATEMLQRTLPYLPPGGVFGVVVPQGVLHDKESKPIRERLLADFELSEISVFADNLFEHGDHEVAVLMGRRKKPRTKPVVLRYRRVREQGMEAFKARLAFTSEREVLPSRFTSNADATNLLLPDLVEVWDCLRELPTLGTVADIQQGFQFLNEDTLKGREVVSKTRRAGWVRAILRAADDYTIWNLPKSVWIDNSPEVFRRPGAATQLGVPQVVLNYAPVAREPWRLKAVIDDEGLAVSSRFLVFREKVGGPSLPVLWALLNCPLANAYAYCISGKRETLVKEWRAFPLPRLTPERKQAIEAAASAYLSAVKASELAFMQADAKNKVKQALLALDAEVLKLYDLPPRLERQLLDLFTGVERKGVGCDFRGYYPPGFTSYLPLHMVISDRFQRAAADATADRFKPGESAYMRDVLGAAAAGAGEE